MAGTHQSQLKSLSPELSANGNTLVIPQIHQQAKQAPHEVKQIHQEANSAWIRTLSRQNIHEPNWIGPSHPLNSHQQNSHTPLPNSPLSEIRANADFVALWQRYHDSACHARLLETHSSHHAVPSQHTMSLQNAVLTTLEHARVLALGSRYFPGVALNIGHYFIKKAPYITRSEMLKGIAFVKFMEKSIPLPLTILSEKWEDHFRCLSDLWEDLSTFIQNQEDFGLYLLAFLEHLPEPPALEDQIGRECFQFKSSPEIDLTPELNMPDVNDSGENSESSEPNPENPPQDSDQGIISHKNTTDNGKAYIPYTTIFDQVLTPTMLVSAKKRAQYRAQLEKNAAPYRQVVSRLARRMIRQLMAWQRRSWLFDQEEGLLDARRLATLVADPFNTQLFMQESETPFPATMVTLLIDNSGSMKGEPILIAALTTEIVASALERCGVKVEILGYTTRKWNGGDSRQQWIESGTPTHPGRLNDLLHIVYKDADTPWRRAKHHLGTMLHPDLLKENIDGEALLWAWHRLLARPEPRRILLVVCDGSPHDEATMTANGREYLVRHLRNAIETIEKSSVHLGAVGIGQNVGRYYHRAVFVQKLEHLGEEVMGLLLDMLAPQTISGNIGSSR